MRKKTIGMYGGKFLPLHAGHVYAITTAACMVDELYVVLSYSNIRDEKLVNEGNIKPLPYTLRLRWLSQITKDMENVHVLAVEDYAEGDDDYDWSQGANDIKKAIGKEIDVVFGSERHYASIFETLYPNASYQLIDPDRENYPISATKIRTEGVYKHWDYIPDVAKSYFAKTVVVVGTESCGKSTLVRYLAKTFNTNYVEEYGRTYTDELGQCNDIMTEEDFYHIAYGHKMKEKEARQQANKLLFIDTEAIVTQYYAKLYQGKCYPLLDEIIKRQNYDLWLFLESDVKWVNDGTRDFGEENIRKENNVALKNLLTKHNIPFHTISGNYQQRFETAHKKTKELLEHCLMIHS